MATSLRQWRRGERSSFCLGPDKGVYALFLREGVELKGIEPGEDGLLYIGLAANREGLKGRCLFDARTRNHSPRKSLAVLLMDELSLTPVLVAKPNSPDTWGLDAASDARLTRWMHDHLELAVEFCDDPQQRETELVGMLAPPLNLQKCVQTAQHKMISAARGAVMASVQPAGAPAFKARRKNTAANETVAHSKRPSPRHFAGADMDTADAIAARYRLNSKSYRQRLRITISWYRKPQDWTFAVGSAEWRDMIAVAERMTGLKTVW